MAVHTLASGDLKDPPRDEVPIGVPWDRTAIQVGNSGMEWRDIRGSATEPSLATLWGQGGDSCVSGQGSRRSEGLEVSCSF